MPEFTDPYWFEDCGSHSFVSVDASDYLSQQQSGAAVSLTTLLELSAGTVSVVLMAFHEGRLGLVFPDEIQLDQHSSPQEESKYWACLPPPPTGVLGFHFPDSNFCPACLYLLSALFCKSLTGLPGAR